MHPNPLKGLDVVWFFFEGFTLRYLSHAPARLMHPNPLKGWDVVWFFLPWASPWAI
jgi:hypothetical protein